MSISVCPIASVHAPIQRVWSFLSQPGNYSQWWDAKTRSIEPQGPAQPGQRIHARSVAFGTEWNVDVLVEGIDEARHALDLRTSLPLGIVVFNHITCRDLDSANCQVSFG